jgi:mannose-6-phosphate isomerase-like protein (cupin superfamily)
MSLPFEQYENEGYLYRTFNPETDSHELVWHRDKKNREVFIIESKKWEFQMDNELPVELNEGDVIYIPKNTYHRVIKGSGELKIRIQEF